jgi:hypothetical protein
MNNFDQELPVSDSMPEPRMSHAERNLGELRRMNAMREANSMKATQGPHNKPASQRPYMGKSPAPRGA